MTRELRVIGPPGTGKTTFIKRQVETWVDHGEHLPDDIMLTSFTRTAARELSGRVPVPDGNVSTLHALAYRALGQPEIAEVGPLAEQWNALETTVPKWRIETPLADTDDGLAMPDQGVGDMMRQYSLARALMAPPTHPLRALTAAFGKAWEDYKRETGSIDFTDMIEWALINVTSCPGEPAVFIADEAQDFVPLQWALVRQWGATVPTFMVAGDPAQVLYSFAGARPDEFMLELPPEQVRLLSQSYRMPRRIHQHAEHLLTAHSGGLSEGRDYKARDVDGEIRTIGADWRNPASLVADAINQVEAGRTVMVLSTCGYMLAPTAARLREAGIPFHNPYRPSNGAWNPLAARGDVSTRDRVAAFADGGRNAELWAPMVRATEFVTRGAKTHIAHGADWREWAGSGLTAAVATGNLHWLADHVTKQYASPAHYASRVIERYGADALDAEPQLTIGSIHSIKGGEADVVYVYPDVSQAGARELMHPNGFDAAVRQAYVAVSRAREELVITRKHGKYGLTL